MEQLNNNNISSLDNFTSNVNGFIPLSNDSFCDFHHHQRPQIPFNETSFNPDGPFYDPAVLSYFLPTSDEGPSSHEPTIIIKPICESESLIKSSPPIFLDNNKSHRNYNSGGKKRKRNNERSEVEKPREVVHVRARRGQATDSHSLAERLRREKINEKLRSLQDLVPGCYKFLSMKLSAASMFFDFNSSEMDALETMQASTGTNGYEAQVMERMVGEGYGGFPQFQSTWPL
ncbi:hypothetical protein LguiA_032446 [Lonicera macranthoides]